MSGGHWNYKQYTIQYLAEDIESDLKEDTIHEMLEDEEENDAALVKSEVEEIILGLKNLSDRVHELDKFVCGDSSMKTYLERIRITKHKYLHNIQTDETHNNRGNGQDG
jgi:hypothetical protein